MRICSGILRFAVDSRRTPEHWSGFFSSAKNGAAHSPPPPPRGRRGQASHPAGHTPAGRGPAHGGSAFGPVGGVGQQLGDARRGVEREVTSRRLGGALTGGICQYMVKYRGIRGIGALIYTTLSTIFSHPRSRDIPLLPQRLQPPKGPPPRLRCRLPLWPSPPPGPCSLPP